MGIFDVLAGKSFGNLRDQMQQGFHGGSYSKGGEAAISAFDPAISKERFANVVNRGVGGGDIFNQDAMGRQANVANTVGKLYSLYALGSGAYNSLGGGGSGGGAVSGSVNPSGGSATAPSGGMPSSFQQLMGGMGGMNNMGGGGGQGGTSAGTASNMQLQQQAQQLQQQQKDAMRNQRLAQLLREYNAA